jgi:anti-anti-sigma factor
MLLLSVSKAFERKRKELFKIANSNASLTSEETLHHSEQLDHFVNLYQNQKLSDLHIAENIEGSKLTIQLKGQLDIITSDELISFLDISKVKWIHLKELYIDLTALKFFDTSGIQSLILLILEARKNNISIETIMTSQTAYEILNIMGIPNALKKFNCGTFIAI